MDVCAKVDSNAKNPLLSTTEEMTSATTNPNAVQGADSEAAIIAQALQEQQVVVESQNKRIEKLEVLVENLLNK